MRANRADARSRADARAQQDALQLRGRWLALGVFLCAATGSLAHGLFVALYAAAWKYAAGGLPFMDAQDIVATSAMLGIVGLAPWGAVSLGLGAPAALLLHKAGLRGTAPLPLVAFLCAVGIAALLLFGAGVALKDWAILLLPALAAAPVAGLVLRAMIYGDRAQGRGFVPDAAVFE